MLYEQIKDWQGQWTSITVGNSVQTEYQKSLMAAMQQLGKGIQVASGSKPVVVCGGAVTEAKDMDEAQAIAEREAHAKSTDAYILKPVRKVAPKRDVVTTELA